MTFDFAGFFRFLRLWFLRLPWTPRRAVVAAAFVVVVPFLQIANGLALLLDELAYPGYRRQRVDAPVFITGNPRSGTTFLHRLLAKDARRFSTMRMWEILLAPSIVMRRLVRAAAAADRRLGSPLRRCRARIERRWNEKNPMHEVSLLAPEEDDYLLLYSWSALTAGLSAGLLEEARPYTFFDTELGARRRRRIMGFYRRCVQRHLRADRARGSGPGRRYLAKNPALCPKLGSLLQTFPDAKIVYLVRNPLEVAASFLSMMNYSWRAVGVRHDGDALREYVLEMVGHWYRYPLERLAELPPQRCAIVRFDDLVADPRGTVTALYERFGLEMDERFAAALNAEGTRARRFRSRHAYAPEELGLSRERIFAEFRDVFERFGFPGPGPDDGDGETRDERRGAASGARSPAGLAAAVLSPQAGRHGG